MGRVLLGIAAGILLVELLTRKEGCIEEAARKAAGKLGDAVGEVSGRVTNVIQEAVDHFQKRYDDLTGGCCGTAEQPEESAG